MASFPFGSVHRPTVLTNQDVARCRRRPQSVISLTRDAVPHKSIALHHILAMVRCNGAVQWSLAMDRPRKIFGCGDFTSRAATCVVRVSAVMTLSGTAAGCPAA